MYSFICYSTQHQQHQQCICNKKTRSYTYILTKTIHTTDMTLIRSTLCGILATMCILYIYSVGCLPAPVSETFVFANAFRPMLNNAIEKAKPRIIRQQKQMVRKCVETIGCGNKVAEHQLEIDGIIDTHFDQMVGEVVDGRE